MPLRSNSSFEEDVVERRVSDPLANALLIVGAICIVGAIAIQIYEIFQYRVEGEDTFLGIAARFTSRLERKVERSWNEFESVRKKAEALAPSKGPGEEGFLTPNAEQMARELMEEYGYGPKALSPVLKERGPRPEAPVKVTPKKKAEKKSPIEIETLEKLEEEPAEKKEGGLDLDLKELEKLNK